jgi:transcriptional regulator with XRE-family HTH domain
MHTLDATAPPDPSPAASTPAPGASTVAARILMAQRLRGLTDTALAKASGLTRAALWHLTRGTSDGAARTAVATIAALAPALACDPAWLAFGPPWPAPRSPPPTLPGVSAEADPPEYGAPLPVAQLRAAMDAARESLPVYVASAPSTVRAGDTSAELLAALDAARTEALGAVRAAVARGVSQGAIARAAGVPQSALSTALAGHTTPRPATVARLAAWARTASTGAAGAEAAA